jgi:hypothetical protein
MYGIFKFYSILLTSRICHITYIVQEFPVPMLTSFNARKSYPGMCFSCILAFCSVFRLMDRDQHTHLQVPKSTI